MGYAGKPDLSSNPVIPPPPQIDDGKRKGFSGMVDSALETLGENSVLTMADKAIRKATGKALYPVERMYDEKDKRWKTGTDERLNKRYGPPPKQREDDVIAKKIEETE